MIQKLLILHQVKENLGIFEYDHMSLFIKWQ